MCATVSQIGRDGEEKHIYTLKELRDLQVDMFTTVFIGKFPDQGDQRLYGDSAGIPGMKKAISYLVFAGTSEGRQLAEIFSEKSDSGIVLRGDGIWRRIAGADRGDPGSYRQDG